MEWTSLGQTTDLLSNLIIILMVILVGVLALLTLVHLLMVVQAVIGQRRNKNTTQATPHDLSGDAPPQKAHDLVTRAQQLGFEYLGAAGFKRDNGMRIDWIYVDEEQTTLMLIVPNGKRYAALFYSVFGDGFTLQTVYPQGVSVQTDTLETNSIKTSLEAAFDFHMTHRLSHRLMHGKLQFFPDMSAVLPWLANHVQQQVPLQLQQMRDQSLQTLAFFATSLIVATIGLYALLTAGISLGLLIVFILVAIGSIFVGRNRVLPNYLKTIEQRKKKKREAK